MHFARYSTITDRTGYNRFVSRSRFTDLRWDFPVLSVHGRKNGLSDVTTVDRMKQILEDAGRNYRSHIIPDEEHQDAGYKDAGHQDCLIGAGREEMADVLIDYFDDTVTDFSPGDANDGFIALTPWIGPIITLDDNPPRPYIRIGARPSMRGPEIVVMLRVQIVDNEIRRHDDGMPFDAGDEDFVLTNMVTYQSNKLRDERWDSFAMPLHPAVPLGGDALLVLVLYAEAEALPMAQANYLSVVAASPLQVVDINPKNWAPNPDAPSPDMPLDKMRDIARDSLTTLLSQQGAPNVRFEASVDPNGVVLNVRRDPGPNDPGVDLAE
jgi:hypothetical protein